MAEKLVWRIECWECATDASASGASSGRNKVGDRKSGGDDDDRRPLYKFQRLESLAAACERCADGCAVSSGMVVAAATRATTEKKKMYASRCLSLRREAVALPASVAAATTTKPIDPVARVPEVADDDADNDDDRFICGYVHVMVPSDATSRARQTDARDRVDDKTRKTAPPSSSPSPSPSLSPTPRVYVEQLWVEPHWRRAGVAGRLMRRLVDELGQRFETTLTVCPIDIPLERLVEFYRRFGFASGNDDPPLRLGCSMLRPASNFPHPSESGVLLSSVP